MTYDEALALKKRIGETIIIKKCSMEIFVTPNNAKDRTTYLEDYRCKTSHFMDEFALKHSSDNKFSVLALYTDGLKVEWVLVDNHPSYNPNQSQD